MLMLYAVAPRVSVQQREERGPGAPRWTRDCPAQAGSAEKKSYTCSKFSGKDLCVGRGSIGSGRNSRPMYVSRDGSGTRRLSHPTINLPPGGKTSWIAAIASFIDGSSLTPKPNTPLSRTTSKNPAGTWARIVRMSQIRCRPGAPQVAAAASQSAVQYSVDSPSKYRPYWRV